jgi:predicted DNA-binding antitoxin AbrB/MazE fold protein
MTLTVEAIYENGVLKPAQPLPLQEHEKVRVTIHTTVSRARQTAGLMGWQGDAELAERFALDPEQDFPPAEAP